MAQLYHQLCRLGKLAQCDPHPLEYRLLRRHPQWNRQAVGMAGLGEELFGAREIGAVPCRLRPYSFGDAVRALRQNPPAIVDRDFQDLTIGYGIGDRLAQLGIVERRLGGIERQVL